MNWPGQDRALADGPEVAELEVAARRGRLAVVDDRVEVPGGIGGEEFAADAGCRP